jgi:pimeloyl-ACP methyl ester carboxylesterase
VRAPEDLWLDRGGVALHLLEWKVDGPPGPSPAILLLHGLGSNAHYWSRVAAHLPHRRLVALDQRGHGLSARPPHAPDVRSGYAMAELLEDIELSIRQTGLDRPVLAGHSWGATVALEFAARHPHSISGLFFVDGPVQSAANLFSWEEGQSYMQPPLPRYSSFRQAVEDNRRELEGAWGDDLEPFAFARLMPDGDSLILTLTAPIRLELLRGLYESQIDLLWTQLQVPAMALLARQGPSRVIAWRETGARKVAEAAPDVEVKWFETPHDIPLHAPAEVAADLERMAVRVSRPIPSEAAARQQLQDR